MSKPSVLVISNLDPRTDDAVFTNDRGTWNVSRALLDCRAGKHVTYLLDVEPAYAANKNVEVDEIKVAAFVQVTDFEPCIGVMEDGAVWLIDGHHRLRAMHLRGDKEFKCYVIEEVDAARYRVLYNGQRLMPKP